MDIRRLQLFIMLITCAMQSAIAMEKSTQEEDALIKALLRRPHVLDDEAILIPTCELASKLVKMKVVDLAQAKDEATRESKIEKIKEAIYLAELLERKKQMVAYQKKEELAYQKREAEYRLRLREQMEHEKRIRAEYVKIVAEQRKEEDVFRVAAAAVKCADVGSLMSVLPSLNSHALEQLVNVACDCDHYEITQLLVTNLEGKAHIDSPRFGTQESYPYRSSNNSNND